MAPYHPVLAVLGVREGEETRGWTELVSGDVYQRGAHMAGSLMGPLAVAMFYSFLVDYHVSSLTGAVKE